MPSFNNVTWGSVFRVGGVFFMMYFLGCDVCKSKVDVSLINEQGIEQWVDKVPNSTKDFTTYLLTLAGSHPNDELQCVVESTGIYHHPVLDACQIANVPCRVYNPLLTKQQIRASVRGKKTDRTDALMIAQIGLRGGGRLHTPEPYRTTKYYARGQQHLSGVGASLKCYEDHLAEVLDKDLTKAASEALAGIQAQIKTARKQFVADTAATAPLDLMQRLQTIPGVGPYIAASLIGEIQDMRRFRSAHALTAYAGLDPKIRQSGHTLNNTGRLTKRGSPYLRHSLFIAASVARQFDPYFRALYDKKRAEGKCYTVAVCVVARKLAAVIRAVWLSEERYNPTVLAIHS
jgi:transposase